MFQFRKIFTLRWLITMNEGENHGIPQSFRVWTGPDAVSVVQMVSQITTKKISAHRRNYAKNVHADERNTKYVFRREKL